MVNYFRLFERFLNGSFCCWLTEFYGTAEAADFRLVDKLWGFSCHYISRCLRRGCCGGSCCFCSSNSRSKSPGGSLTAVSQGHFHRVFSREFNLRRFRHVNSRQFHVNSWLDSCQTLDMKSRWSSFFLVDNCRCIMTSFGVRVSCNDIFHSHRLNVIVLSLAITRFFTRCRREVNRRGRTRWWCDSSDQLNSRCNRFNFWFACLFVHRIRRVNWVAIQMIKVVEIFRWWARKRFRPKERRMKRAHDLQRLFFNFSIKICDW